MSEVRAGHTLINLTDVEDVAPASGSVGDGCVR
jgi:hypothetical protein